MLIGKKESFAVEYELEKNHGGIWMFGKICYWINYAQIGDYELETSLRDVLFAMKYIIHDCGNREGFVLCERSPEETFFQLSELLYGDIDNVSVELPDMPARFDVRIMDEVFKYWKIFLFDCNDFAIILYKKDIEESVHYFHLNRGEFDNVINQLYSALDSIYESILIT